MIARDQAPAAFAAWDELIGAVASTTPSDLTELARAIARASLDPAVSAVPASDATAFAEQLVVDVASMTDEVRAAGLAELGPGAPAFVLAVWTEDMMIRAGTAWSEMFGEEWIPRPTSAESAPWVAHERFLLEVAKLSALDPVTSELVRLRGARAHDCRLCQSRRNVSALNLAGRSDLFDDRNPSGISVAQALALQVVDAFVWQPIQWPPGLGGQIVDALGPAGATELTLDIVRNAANKIAVAFDADDAAGGDGGRVLRHRRVHRRTALQHQPGHALSLHNLLATPRHRFYSVLIFASISRLAAMDSSTELDPLIHAPPSLRRSSGKGP